MEGCFRRGVDVKMRISGIPYLSFILSSTHDMSFEPYKERGFF
jgi:hypothetical protein